MSMTDAFMVKTANIEPIFKAIQNEEAPEVFDNKFLELRGYTTPNDALFTYILKDLGFTDAKGVPTDRYFDFQKSKQSGQVLAGALRDAYGKLFDLKPQAHSLSPDDLQEALREIYTDKKSDAIIKYIANTFLAMSKLADWDNAEAVEVVEEKAAAEESDTPQTTNEGEMKTEDQDSEPEMVESDELDSAEKAEEKEKPSKRKSKAPAFEADEEQIEAARAAVDRLLSSNQQQVAETTDADQDMDEEVVEEDTNDEILADTEETEEGGESLLDTGEFFSEHPSPGTYSFIDDLMSAAEIETLERTNIMNGQQTTQTLNGKSESHGSLMESYVLKAMVNRAEIYRKLDDSENALTANQDIINRFDSDTKNEFSDVVFHAMINKADILQQSEEYDRALDAYDALISRFGDNDKPFYQEHIARALMAKAQIMQANGRLDEALAIYEDMISRYDK